MALYGCGQTRDPNDMRQWLGLGPDDAYPNKKAACVLGVWDASKMTGTRQARWLMLRNASGQQTQQRPLRRIRVRKPMRVRC